MAREQAQVGAAASVVGVAAAVDVDVALAVLAEEIADRDKSKPKAGLIFNATVPRLAEKHYLFLLAQ